MGAKTVLAIDDHKNLLKLLRANLEAAGYEVITATSTAKGISLVDEVKPALILLDIMMEEMDGIQALRKIRTNSNVPVIMLTALDNPDTVARAIEAGADDYITKPFTVRQLLARVSAKMRHSPPGEQSAET